MSAAKPQTIDAYIATFPDNVQIMLSEIRETIHCAAPAAEEVISYDIPTFKFDGKPLIYFAGWKKHIALYPISAAISEALHDDLASYKGTKGSVHFPLGKSMPLDLIDEIVKLRLKEMD